MLCRNFDDLHKHIGNGDECVQGDKFFDGNDRLFIIDDYHFNIKNERKAKELTISFINALVDTGVRFVTIYIQAKNCNDNDIQTMRNYCDRYNLPYTSIISFLTLTGVQLRKCDVTNDPRGWFCDKIGRMRQYGNIALNVINEAKKHDIVVNYQYYDNLRFRPPFHGRYWITPRRDDGSRGKGYIVDGSLNTVADSIVFFQLMDDENYDLVEDRFSRNVLTNSRDYAAINKESIESMMALMEERMNYHLEHPYFDDLE